MEYNEFNKKPTDLVKSADKNVVLDKYPNIMYNKEVHNGGTMRPQLTVRSQTIVQLFLDRKIFESQANVVEEALELLLENQLQKESQEDRGTVLGEEFLEAQLEVIGE